MSLSELMSRMDLSVYPQIALVLFLAAFAGICVRVFSPKRRGEFRGAAMLPLDDSPAAGDGPTGVAGPVGIEREVGR